MDTIEYQLINKPVGLSKIKSEYKANNIIYFSIEKTSQKDQVYFFNPEFAFEKQLLTNADPARLFTYLKMAEKYPEAFERFKQSGLLFIKMDNNLLTIFVRHIAGGT